jgi:hypothetical protein
MESEGRKWRTPGVGWSLVTANESKKGHTMRNRMMGVCLTFAAFAALAGCAATEVTPDAVAVVDTAVVPGPDRGERPVLATGPDEAHVPVPEAVAVPEPVKVDIAVPEADAATVGATVPAGDATPEEDAGAPEGESPEEPREEPEYVSPEESDLPPVDEDAVMDCVDWAQADGLAYEDAAALCDGLSSEGYPTSDLTHEEYEWNFTDRAQRQGL